MLSCFAYRRQCIGGEDDIVVVGPEKDAIPETHIGVVLNDENLFVTHDRQPMFLVAKLLLSLSATWYPSMPGIMMSSRMRSGTHVHWERCLATFLSQPSSIFLSAPFGLLGDLL
jgi:hypothetical protein